MKDLKIKEDKNNVQETVSSSKPNKPHYPYEMGIRLEKKVLQKLGLSVDDFEVGENITFKAKGKITELSKRENEYDDGARECVSIQITAINMDEIKSKAAMKIRKLASQA